MRFSSRKILPYCRGKSWSWSSSCFLVDPPLFLIGPGFNIGRRGPVKTRHDQRIELRGRSGHALWGEQITRNLPDRKLVERHIRVHRADHPIAIRPDIAEVIALKPVRVGIPREVEPWPRPTFAILRRSEQAIHDPLVRGITGVSEKRSQRVGRRRQTNEIQRHPPQPAGAPRIRRRREALLSSRASTKRSIGFRTPRVASPSSGTAGRSGLI